MLTTNEIISYFELWWPAIRLIWNGMRIGNLIVRGFFLPKLNQYSLSISSRHLTMVKCSYGIQQKRKRISRKTAIKISSHVSQSLMFQKFKVTILDKLYCKVTVHSYSWNMIKYKSFQTFPILSTFQSAEDVTKDT